MDHATHYPASRAIGNHLECWPSGGGGGVPLAVATAAAFPQSSDGSPAPMSSGEPTPQHPCSLPGPAPATGDTVHVPVECGGKYGILLLPKGRILIADPGPEGMREVSPTEFERLGGKGAAKKWRQSIRLRDGEQGGTGGGGRGGGGVASVPC